ncbi:sensor histidine kinase [Egbenema bharatensis]|uniref:sensor histidine kinase n=1 Tax=Egbenema bharatensis TaxID=3463334 RepID=UPI003A86320E
MKHKRSRGMTRYGLERKTSLGQQLLAGFGLSIATVGISTLWINHRLIQVDLGRQAEERAQTITQSLEFSIEGLLEIEEQSILRRVVQNYATLPAVIEIAIVSPDGRTIAQSGQIPHGRIYAEVHPELIPVMDQALERGADVSQEIKLNGEAALVQILPFQSTLFGTVGQRGLAVVILDLQQLRQDAEQTFLTSTITLVIGIVLLLLLMARLLQQQVLHPLNSLNQAVNQSKRTGLFTLPPDLPPNEVRFLATTFDTVFKQLEAYDQLQAEITQRRQVEAILRESEARERQKSNQLEATVQELRKAQTQLVQSEKMSSLGQLVAGVAHEINNPVNFIHGNLHHANHYIEDLLDLLRLYQQCTPPIPTIQDKEEEIDLDFLQSDLPKLLASMKVGADRIREIVQSLRSFSRLDEAEVKDVDIHEGLDSTLMILHNRLKAKSDHPPIQIIKDYAQLPKIECYAGQLNQVFMNILSNAIDALDEQNMQRSKQDIAAQPSQITIQTRPIQDDRIAIHIIDNGPGMPAPVQQRLFDPFFTTKPVGKGTGMGMSISYQIVTDRHQGSLHCISAIGQGTEFVIEIPVQQTNSRAIGIGTEGAGVSTKSE